MRLSRIFYGRYDEAHPVVRRFSWRYQVFLDAAKTNKALAPMLHLAQPAEPAAFGLAHDGGYASQMVDVLEGRSKAYPWFAIDFERQGLGGTLAAVEYAIQKRATAYHLGGGYHHARWDRPGSIDYCNDVACALVLAASRLSPGDRILYLDVDAHAPDGVQAILERLPAGRIVDQVSIHMASEKLRSSGQGFGQDVPWNIGLPENCSSSVYLAELERVCATVLSERKYQFAFVQAGVDPLVGDPTADMRLDYSALYRRDRLIASLLDTLACPAAIVLGGGHKGKDSGIAALNTALALSNLDPIERC